MLRIEDKWDEISEAIRSAVKFISSLGYNRSRFIQTDALIPISYYLYKKNSPTDFIDSIQYSDDRKNIGRWLVISFLNRVFGGQSDTGLRQTIEIIKSAHSSFPLEEIVNRLKETNKIFRLDEKDIEIAGRTLFFI